MIALVDYGMGNIRSVEKAFEYLGSPVKVTNNPQEIKKADAIVLPGVGAFADCMKNLADQGLDLAIKEQIVAGKPYLGICLGLQILFEKSFEGGVNKGLSVLKGSVRRLPENVKVPHMGWNEVKVEKFTTLFLHIKVPIYTYFVHSYYADAADKDIIGTTNHGIKFCCAVSMDNVYGVQFHPEKSGKVGLQIIKNFTEIVNAYIAGY